MGNLENQVLKYFPENIFNLIERYLNQAEEIRIRQARKIVIKTNNENIIINHIVSSEEIIECLQRICEYSIYSYQNQIAQGFITVLGGHRVGITGSCVCENGQVININYINSLNFRIARQIIGAGKNILPEVLNKDSIYNSIIISPPRIWKNNNFKRFS